MQTVLNDGSFLEFIEILILYIQIKLKIIIAMILDLAVICKEQKVL